MTFYPKQLSQNHARQLKEGSGIADEIIAERGYYTAARRSEVPDTFKDYQRRPGLLILTRSPDGVTTRWRLRANRPRKGKDGKPRKYEQPTGASCILDVHPRNLEKVQDPALDLWITEGEKKGDSLTTRGLVSISLAGVWNFQKDGELLPCWEHVALAGRRVFVVFDSDVMEKENVQLALERLVGKLEDRGADVRVVYLPEGADGSKLGVDDYLATGHTVAELRMLARTFEASDVGRIRLSRDEKLRAMAQYLWGAWRDRDWMRFTGKSERGNWQRGHTARDVMDSMIKLALKNGKIVDGGLVVRVGLRRLSELAAKSAPSVGHAIMHLEADGQLEILPPEDRSKARSYRLLVPRAALYSMEEEARGQRESNFGVTKISPTCKGLRAPTAPRLRWSWPARVGRLVRHTSGITGRTVAEAVGDNVFVSSDYRPYSGRLGPHRGAVLDALEHAGGELHLDELCEVLHRDRPRDVRRRVLPRLEEAGIIGCEGDVIRLSAEWLARLDECREADGEIEQAEKQAKKHKRQRDSYRLHIARAKNGAPKASEAAVVRTHELRERRLREMSEERERDEAPTPPEVERLVHRVMEQNAQIRMSLLSEIAMEEGLRWRDIPPAVRRLGYLVERLPEYGNAEFVLAREHAPAGPPARPLAPPPTPPPEPTPDDHSLDCECDACLCPAPRYARPYGGSGRRSA